MAFDSRGNLRDTPIRIECPHPDDTAVCDNGYASITAPVIHPQAPGPLPAPTQPAPAAAQYPGLPPPGLHAPALGAPASVRSLIAPVLGLSRRSLPPPRGGVGVLPLMSDRNRSGLLRTQGNLRNAAALGLNALQHRPEEAGLHAATNQRVNRPTSMPFRVPLLANPSKPVIRDIELKPAPRIRLLPLPGPALPCDGGGVNLGRGRAAVGGAQALTRNPSVPNYSTSTSDPVPRRLLLGSPFREDVKLISPTLVSAPNHPTHRWNNPNNANHVPNDNDCLFSLYGRNQRVGTYFPPSPRRRMDHLPQQAFLLGAAETGGMRISRRHRRCRRPKKREYSS